MRTNPDLSTHPTANPARTALYLRRVVTKRTVWDWISHGVTLLVFLHLYQRLRIKY